MNQIRLRLSCSSLEMVGAPDEVRQAFAESFLLRVGTFQRTCAPRAGVTARERALATLAPPRRLALLARPAGQSYE